MGLTSGSQRPGQAGTTGQLFFSKCGDPPKGCECKFEAPKGKYIDNPKTMAWVKYLFAKNSTNYIHL